MLRTTLGFASVVFLVQACSADVSPDASRPMARVITPFRTWCTNWQLTCPSGTPPDMPSEGSPWTDIQWKSLMGALRSITRDDVDVVVTRKELEDRDLVHAADLIGAGSIFASFKKLVADTGLSEAQLGQGKVALKFDGTGKRKGASGLEVTYEKDASLSATDDGGGSVSGVAIGGPGAIGTSSPGLPSRPRTSSTGSIRLARR